MGVDFTITDALNVWLEQLSPAPPIAWENQDFDKTDETYLEASVSRDPPEGMTLDGWPRRTGFFTVSVVGMLGQGSDDALALAESVQSLFPVNLRLPADEPVLRVRSVPHIGDGYPDGSRWRVPVTIYFESYSKET